MRDKLMSKYKIYIFSLLLVFFMMRIFADDANALSKHLMSFQTMTADFTQTVYDENHQVIQKNVGTMALSRPVKFRWAVETPNAQLLIADGAYLWIYDVDLSQATRQKLDKNKTTSPASLLSGSIENLEARFKVTQLNHTDNFKLVPKNKDDLFQSIVLSFTQNKLMAAVYYTMAAELAHPDASEALLRVSAELSPKETAMASRLAQTCIKRAYKACESALNP